MMVASVGVMVFCLSAGVLILSLLGCLGVGLPHPLAGTVSSLVSQMESVGALVWFPSALTLRCS